MALRVTLIQGGGTGLDQAPAVLSILRAAGAAIEWEEHLAGWASMERGGVAIPETLLRSVRDTGLVLKTKLLPPPGPAAGPRPEQVNFNVQLRRELGLFASVRPLKNLVGLPARFQGVDMLVIRELTEDLYAAIEHEIVPGVVQSIKVVTAAASRRFFRFAFEWARSAGRKTVTCVHKANILKLADGLFLEAFRTAAKDFPDLLTREIIVDNCCMQMVSRPQQFDVLVMGNLYGDLVSDLGAGVVGGVSATAGINIGDGVRVYESFHGGPRETAGVNGANPLPLLLPAIDLLDAEGQKPIAQRILPAVERVLSEGRALPRDLGGQASTTEMSDAIIAALK
ncbi:MAG TPA: isocitrate/isopropylmalate family dehydrogenase [Gemmataceae bacterium]|jgi:isocitrate dehydrogenase (NAD+)